MHYIHRFRSSTIEKIVGFFVLLSGIGLILAIFIVLHSQKVLEKKYRLKATFGQGYGLNIGAKVYLAGLEVGIVESIRFDRTNKVRTALLIQKNFQEKIRRDSIATIARMGMFGDKNVSISIGAKDLPALLDGEEIKSEDPSEIADLAGEIKPVIEEIGTVVKNIKSFTAELNAKAVPVLENLREISEGLSQGEGPLGAALKDEGLLLEIKESVSLLKRSMTDLKESAENIKEASRSLPEMATKGNKMMDTASEDLSQIMSRGKEAMENMEDFSHNLKEGSEALPDIVGRTKEGVSQANEVIGAVKKNWLIKRYLPKEEEAAITIQKRDSQYK